MKKDQTINLEGYHFYAHNRQHTHINAPKGSGGVGIFVRNSLFDVFEVNIIDQSYDGILGVLLKSKQTEYEIVIYAVHLPPENSPWGRNATDFYAHLLGQIYLLSDKDAIFVCGDLNSRIGELSDIISDIDGIPRRVVLDKNVNQHGHTFIDFLIDSKMCVLNGRFCNSSDNFTSVSTKGRSVVDFISVPHDCFSFCENFEVISPTSIINNYNMQSLLGERSRVPDHNFLCFTYKYMTDFRDNEEASVKVTSNSPFNTKVFKLKRIPENFLTSELARNAFLDIICNIERCRENQNHIDRLYEEFCNTLIKQMNENIPSFDCSKKTRKRYKQFKPYWDENLERLWQDLRSKESDFLKFHGNRSIKNHLRNCFKTARNNFDKQLRSAERKYKRSLSLDVESVCTENSKAFWDHLKRLGPRRKGGVPLEVYDDDGNIISNENFVFQKWSKEFENLYNLNRDSQNYDQQFYDKIVREKVFLEDRMLDPLYEENTSLNASIMRSEVEKVVNRAKNGKSVGFDKIPYEILKFPIIIDVLHSLFNLCFDTGILPSIWRKAMISPIPKDDTKDKRIPLNYRGISLLSVVSKLYSAVLNNRLLNYMENEHLLAEEQNGFRRKRSCEEHVYSACTLIRNRLLNKQDTFGVFIDFQKAFDFVDRNVLLYKLLSNGINGKIYNSIKSMLTDTSSCVKLNGILTDWFPVLSGVRQGDSSSPTIFAFFINDLIEGLKAMNKGIKFDESVLCILTYADDVLLLAENENDMQDLLNFVYEWCKKWRLQINFSKTNAIHFRNRGKRCSDFELKLGNQSVAYTSVYRYLGVHLNEHLDFSTTADTLSKAGGRALGAVISKIQNYKEVGFKTFSKLYYSCVVPVVDYCSSIWGFKNFDKIDMIQNRAIRYFLGVHRFTPILAITGDMGWIISTHRRWVNMLRLWNRLISMDRTRLPRIVFESDYCHSGKTWCSDIKSILGQVGLLRCFRDKAPVNLKDVENILLNGYKSDWLNKMQNVSKLRTYMQFKNEYATEKYLLSSLSKNEKSHLAQFRCGFYRSGSKLGDI